MYRPAQFGPRSSVDSFPHVETGAEAGDRLSLGTFLEFLDEASPEVLPGHFSHRKLEHFFFLTL